MGIILWVWIGLGVGDIQYIHKTVHFHYIGFDEPQELLMWTITANLVGP